MSEKMLFWVRIDFGFDHNIVRCVSFPGGDYKGPYVTFREAKRYIRLVTRVEVDDLFALSRRCQDATLTSVLIVDVKEDAE